MTTPAPNPVESAEWTVEGNPRFSDAAIDALVLLGFDLVEADDVDLAAAGALEGVDFENRENA